MKFRDILRTANANLFRSKARTILTIISIFIGAFTLTLVVGISSGISSYIDEQLGNVGAENVLMVQPKVDVSFGSGPKEYDPEKKSVDGASLTQIPTLSPEDLKTIDAHEQITRVEPVRAAAAEYAQYADNKKYDLSVTSYIDETQLELEAGRLPDNKATGHEILLPVVYVEPMGLGSASEAINKQIKLVMVSPATGQQTTVEATVVGVQSTSLLSSAGASGNRTLMLSMDTARTLGMPTSVRDQVTAAAAYMKTDLTKEQIDQLKKDLADQGFSAQTIQDQIGVVDQVIKAITYVLLFFGAIALLAASFGIINTLFMAVQERTKEIGLMKAMGMSRRRVFLLFSIEAILIGFWGSILGVGAALGVGQIANQVATSTFLKDLDGFELTVFPLASVLIITLIVMGIAFLAGTLPARRASKLDPIEALRYE